MIEEVFIRMCESAEKIQKLRKYEEGDIFYIRKGTAFEYNDELGSGQLKEDLTIMLKNIGGGRYYSYAMRSYRLEVGSVFSEDPHGRIYKLEDVIWLPTQDQLQQIAFEHLKQKYPAYEQGKITGYNYNVFNLLNAFNDYVSFFYTHATLSPNNHNLIETTSIEQLWFRFVMNRVYDRIWSGGEWM
jgi:hypothetical protein